MSKMEGEDELQRRKRGSCVATIVSRRVPGCHFYPVKVAKPILGIRCRVIFGVPILSKKYLI